MPSTKNSAFVVPTSSKPSPKNSAPMPETTSPSDGFVSAQVGGMSSATVMVNCCEASGAIPFEALTVTGNDPVAAGVQAMTPVVSPTVIPAGGDESENVGTGRP